MPILTMLFLNIAKPVESETLSFTKTVYENTAILTFILIFGFLKNAEIVSDLDFIAPKVKLERAKGNRETLSSPSYIVVSSG